MNPTKNFKSLLVVGASCLLVQSIYATSLFTEGFNYTAGNNLAGQGGWTGASSTALQTGSANLTYAGLADIGSGSGSLVYASGIASASDVASLSSTVTSGSVYYSFLFNCTALGTGNSYITSLQTNATAAPSGGGDPLAFYAKLSGSGYVVGVRHQGVGSGATYASTTVLSLNTTYMAVLQYTFGSGGAVSMFLNPDATLAQPGTASVAIAAGGVEATAGIANVGFKAQSANSNGSFIIDTMRIGTSWSDVVVTVPEPTTMSLLGFGVLGLVMRYRRMHR